VVARAAAVQLLSFRSASHHPPHHPPRPDRLLGARAPPPPFFFWLLPALLWRDAIRCCAAALSTSSSLGCSTLLRSICRRHSSIAAAARDDIAQHRPGVPTRSCASVHRSWSRSELQYLHAAASSSECRTNLASRQLSLKAGRLLRPQRSACASLRDEPLILHQRFSISGRTSRCANASDADDSSPLFKGSTSSRPRAIAPITQRPG